jgi:hypothetical protein
VLGYLAAGRDRRALVHRLLDVPEDALAKFISSSTRSVR